jgi:hypothetical protein
MKRMESGGVKLRRQERAEFACGDISQQLVVAQRFGDNGESRGGFH